MNIELEQKSPTDALIKITLNESDYQPEVEKKIKQYSKQIHLKGFRPGKVPPAIVKRMYGKSIMIEEINHLLSHAVHDYIVSQHLSVVGDPLPDEDTLEEIDWENQKEFAFNYKIGTVPEFSYDLQSISVTAYEVIQDDTQLTEIIDSIRKRYGTTIQPDITEAGDFLYGNLKQIPLESSNESTPDESTPEESEYASEENIPFEKSILLPLNQVNEEVVDRFIGIQKDHVVQVEIQELFKSGVKGINLATGIPMEEAENLSGTFEFVLDSITRTEPAELNEELFLKLFPHETITDEESFREKVKTIVSTNFQKDVDLMLDQQIREELLKQTNITLPDDFLVHWLEVINEGKFSKEQIENEYDGFADNLRWDLIKSKMVEDFGIEVQYEEVEAKAQQMILAQFGGYLPEDSELLTHLDSIVKNYLTQDKGKNYQRLYKEVIEDKVYTILREEVDTTTVQVSAEEFENIMQE